MHRKSSDELVNVQVGDFLSTKFSAKYFKIQLRKQLMRHKLYVTSLAEVIYLSGMKQPSLVLKEQFVRI